MDLEHFVDFLDFGSQTLLVSPPRNFDSSSSFEVVILGDAIFEAQEQIVVSLTVSQFTDLPTPFMSRTNESAPGSIIRLPDVDRIKFEFPSTTIIIQEGKLLQVW